MSGAKGLATNRQADRQSWFEEAVVVVVEGEVAVELPVLVRECLSRTAAA